MAAPTVTPLDAKRAELRAEGWNEAQIDEILKSKGDPPALPGWQ
jgi:hypothetical protein